MERLALFASSELEFIIYRKLVKEATFCLFISSNSRIIYFYLVTSAALMMSN